uniref:Uncharacterized protein n=1 Tax=Opuntia streptacantha TaxID=393608 RepID=A0A7C9EPG5_OPUST
MDILTSSLSNPEVEGLPTRLGPMEMARMRFPGVLLGAQALTPPLVSKLHCQGLMLSSPNSFYSFSYHELLLPSDRPLGDHWTNHNGQSLIHIRNPTRNGLSLFFTLGPESMVHNYC